MTTEQFLKTSVSRSDRTLSLPPSIPPSLPPPSLSSAPSLLALVRSHRSSLSPWMFSFPAYSSPLVLCTAGTTESLKLTILVA